jgi:ElaB/YqjD/DUF883 family membrane-anchored ribosome-binding protein
MADTTDTAAAAASEQRSPEEIRRDIEETRGELGDTVEALAAKADVKAQAKERVSDVKENVSSKADDLKQKASDVTPASVQSSAQQNPLPFAIGGALVAGFLLGRLTARG